MIAHKNSLLKLKKKEKKETERNLKMSPSVLLGGTISFF